MSTGWALLLAIMASTANAQHGWQRYNETTSVRVNGRVIAVGDTTQQLRQNRPSKVNGNAYTFSDNRVTATCYVGSRGTCYSLRVKPKR